MKSHLKSLRKNQSALPWILFIFIMTFFFLLFGIGTSSLAAQILGPDHLKNIIDLQSISLKKINSSIYLGWKWDFRRDLFRFQTLIIVEKCSLKINNKKIMNELMIRPLPSFLLLLHPCVGFLHLKQNWLLQQETVEKLPFDIYLT